MTKLRINSIGFRIFIWFLLCSFFLLSLYSVVNYKRIADQNSRQVSEIALKNVLQGTEYLDILANGYDSLSKSITGNFDILRLISNEPVEPVDQVIADQNILNILASVYYSRKDIIGIYLLTETDRIYGYGEDFQAIDLKYSQADWYRQLTESSRGQMIWYGLQDQSLIDQSWQKPVFAFGRLINDPVFTKPMGVVLFEVDPTPVKKTLNNMRMGTSGHTHILSSADTELAAESGARPLSAEELKSISLNNGDTYTVVNRPDSMLIMAEQASFKWKVISVAQKKDLYVEIRETRRFHLIVLAVLIAFSIGLATFFSRSISSPLIKIIREMKQVQQGNFNGHLDIKSFEEVNFLVAAFNKMVGQINQLVDRVRIISISEKTAQLHALQSQVNPHFLYNTLDMIYWMLDDKENIQVDEIILSLSKMFRYSSDWENSLNVTIEEEADQVKNYLFIIQSRMGGTLSFELDIPAERMQLRLPKMTLQPLIENAVIHGFSASKNGGGCIRVYSEADGLKLKIHISDNGKGIARENLLLIQEQLRHISCDMDFLVDPHAGAAQNGEVKVSNIGLINVHRRLVLKFGPAYGLEVESAENENTVVTVILPILPKGETK
jgi:two-component system sensor histidine kinase YesM